MICPQCRSAECVRSRRSGILDFLCSGLGFRPWRCETCDVRFYADRVAIYFSRYAHCPRCGNFDLDRIASKRVGERGLAPIMRFLGFPAYRCDPCREKFFTLLPFRRIVPSMIPAIERRNVGVES